MLVRPAGFEPATLGLEVLPVANPRPGIPGLTCRPRNRIPSPPAGSGPDSLVPVTPWGHGSDYRRGMATKEQRGASWRVYWRLGGVRGGAKQSTTWRTEPRADKAKKIAEAHGHAITSEEVYAAVLGKKYIPAVPLAEAPVLLPTLAEWAEVWLAARTRIGPRQRRTYRRQLDNRILPALGHLRLDEVDGTAVAKFLNSLLASGLERETVTRYYACLHAMLAFAVAEKKIPDNPAKRTDWIRDLIAHDDTGEEAHVYLTRAEFDLVRNAADPRARPLIDCLADTGARFSEATALDVGDAELGGRMPGVRVTKAWKTDEDGVWYRGSTKGRNRRFVPLPGRTTAVLAPLTKDRSPAALLFTAPKGGRVVHSNWTKRFWAPAVARAQRCVEHPPPGAGRQVEADQLAGPTCGNNGGTGRRGKQAMPCGARVSPGWDRCSAHRDPPPLTVSTCDCPGRLHKAPTPHDLRHSHVAWLIAAGRPLYVISRRLGHRSTKVTETVYAGILRQVDEETVAALAAFDAPEVAAVVVPKHRRQGGRSAPGRRTIRVRHVAARAR